MARKRQRIETDRIYELIRIGQQPEPLQPMLRDAPIWVCDFEAAMMMTDTMPEYVVPENKVPFEADKAFFFECVTPTKILDGLEIDFAYSDLADVMPKYGFGMLAIIASVKELGLVRPNTPEGLQLEMMCVMYIAEDRVTPLQPYWDISFAIGADGSFLLDDEDRLLFGSEPNDSAKPDITSFAEHLGEQEDYAGSDQAFLRQQAEDILGCRCFFLAQLAVLAIDWFASEDYVIWSHPSSTDERPRMGNIPVNKVCDSPIEAKFYNAVQLEIPDLVPQFPIGRYRVDFAIPDQKIAVELDGHDYHKTREQRTHDAKRQRALEAQGWRVIRFTGSEIHKDVDTCVAEAKRLIEVINNATEGDES